jgi:hypothetical protein
MTTEEKAREIMTTIFNLQHTDSQTKMICLSTYEIAIYMVDEIIKTAGFDNYDYWKEVKNYILTDKNK